MKNIDVKLPDPAKEYDPPMNADEIKSKYGIELYNKLFNDPAHKFRMDSGIELIHKEPTKDELIRICSNWLAMDKDKQIISDNKSIELFGRKNIDHYMYLINNCYNSPYTMETLPDLLYFSSNKKLDKLTGKVFLSPYIGISSIFIINAKEVLIDLITKKYGSKLMSYSFNIGYKEWDADDSCLLEPLDFVHITHNIPDNSLCSSGTSYGYIYEIDVSNFKDKLSLFVTNDPNREVIYQGIDDLPIKRIIPHHIEWSINYDKDNARYHGTGRYMNEKQFDLQILAI